MLLARAGTSGALEWVRFFSHPDGSANNSSAFDEACFLAVLNVNLNRSPRKSCCAIVPALGKGMLNAYGGGQTHLLGPKGECRFPQPVQVVLFNLSAASRANASGLLN